MPSVFGLSRVFAALQPAVHVGPSHSGTLSRSIRNDWEIRLIDGHSGMGESRLCSMSSRVLDANIL
jgi:hypothetical protein